MAKLKKATCEPKPAKIVELTNNVLDMSVTMGLLGADVVPSDIQKLEHLL